MCGVSHLGIFLNFECADGDKKGSTGGSWLNMCDVLSDHSEQ